MQTSVSPEKIEERVQPSSRLDVFNVFRRDYKRYDGAPRINIYLLRILFTLMFLFVASDSWKHIFSHIGPWDNIDAAAWCMWATYSTISIIGIVRPLKMLPIVFFEIVYKVVWLTIVAYPLWAKNELIGSPAESMTRVFLWVVLPIVAMPWRYFFMTYILGRRTA
jgi:hypothetical protein